MRVIKGNLAGLILASVAFISIQPGNCDESFIHDTAEVGSPQGGIVMSDQLLELGVCTSNGLRLEGEQCMRLGNIDRAIKLLQRALEMSPDDMDGRVLYAIALEKKLNKQNKDKRDPKLYNFCIKQWYYVAKNSQFFDQKSQAIKHLDKLTGKLPKWHERPAKYLSRVLIPEDGSVKVTYGTSSAKGKALAAKQAQEEEALR